MGNLWIEALKEYNKGHNNWCVVKKNTKEYDEVKKIMEKKKSIKKDGVIIHDRRTFEERNADREKASKLAKAGSAQKRREDRAFFNPSKTFMKEYERYSAKLPKKQIINKDYIPIGDLSQTKKKKKQGVIL